MQISISDKYLAGFLDADGSFGIKLRPLAAGRVRPYLWLQASQKGSNGFVIHEIARKFGGSVNTVYDVTEQGEPRETARWDCPPKQARMLLGRIAQYFVLRRSFARWCLSADRMDSMSKVEGDALLVDAKAKRLMRSDPLPNFPTRKWMAGYIDGNGCFASALRRRKHSTSAVLEMRIADGTHDIEGLELLLKAFGGKLYPEPNRQRVTWVLNLEPSKAREFIPYFAKHLLVKKAQAYFVLACADGGNYRDGEPIHRAMQHLKTQEQRLSGTEVDVSFLVRQVRFDVADRRGWHMKKAAI